jgi:lysine-N-methylase
MISIIPDGFNDFTCKAGKCRHTCCQTWEIDIDEDTAAYYLSLGGELGKRLKKAIGKNADGYYFKLNHNGFCHFLRKDGLCEIITELGEDKLCDICTVHPRFFTYVEDYILCGTGLCCEAACEILAGLKGPLYFTEEDTGRRLSLEALLTDMALELPPESCHYTPEISVNYYKALLSRLAVTEPIDTAWTKEMETLPQIAVQLTDKAKQYQAVYNRELFDRLYQFILYRQLDKCLDYEPEIVARYAKESTDYIFLKAALTGDPLEAMRRWSEQIEYDTENVDLLLQSMEKEK